MKKIILLLILLYTQNELFAQRIFYFEKDIDFDKVIDTVYLDSKKSVLTCRLSSNDFKKIESKEIYIHSMMSGIIDAKNGFEFANHGMRAGSGFQFRYDKKVKKIRLIGMSIYAFGGYTNDGSGESSVNLLTGDYIGNWNYYDEQNEKLVKMTPIKSTMKFDKIYFEDFSENTDSEYSDESRKLYLQFKRIAMNK